MLLTWLLTLAFNVLFTTGPMNTGNLQAGSAATCAIATNIPATGFVPGQQYTVTATGSTERLVQAGATRNTGINGGTSVTWTATQTQTASFQSICATARAGTSYFTSTTVNAAADGGGGGGGGTL